MSTNILDKPGCLRHANIARQRTPETVDEYESRQTSPLVLVNMQFNGAKENPQKRVSKTDFSYLSSKMSPKAKSWVPPENIELNKQPGLEEFMDCESQTSSVSNYNDASAEPPAFQGVLEENESKQQQAIDREYVYHEAVGAENSLSARRSISRASVKSNIRGSQNNDFDSTNNMSSLMDISIPTQDIDNFVINKDIDPHSESIDYGADKTPIVEQYSFAATTPMVKSTPEFTENNSLTSPNQPITETAGSDVTAAHNYDRIQSTTSSLYSAIPSRKFAEAKKLDASERIQSLSSSVYSEIPSNSVSGINTGLKSFRISSLKQTSDNGLNKFHSGESQDKPQLKSLPRRSEKRPLFTNTYQSVTENERLNFVSPEEKTPDNENISSSATQSTELKTAENDHKVRVSVLNQSVFSTRYEPKRTQAGEASFSAAKSSPTSDSPSRLSFTPSNASNPIYGNSNEHRHTFDLNDEEMDEYDDETDEEDASALFVTAIYAFNSETLESENDSSICLSFDQDEIAFTYNLDDSGWGEVTLLSSLKRGWVPMNYFRSTITSGFSENQLKSMPPQELTETRASLRILLKHAGAFLLNPQSKPVYIDGELRGYTFDVECFNGMTDGIRKLLVDTDCISRSNSVVQNKPVVRKMRKKLLRGWADLIGKGKDYMGTIASTKIEYLQLLTFHLLQKAITFLDIWGLEQDKIQEQQELPQSAPVTDRKDTVLDWDISDSLTLNMIYLDQPPILSYRINEIYNQLITYLCLIAGRIDLVEHNPQSFQVVGLVVSHINLLVNEYFFIIKLLKSTLNEDESEKRLSKNLSKYGKLTEDLNLKNQLKSLDIQTEKLTQMVEELNSYIRILHSSSKKDLFNRTGNAGSSGFSNKNASNLYFYSREGGAVVVCACKMIELSSNAYYILKHLIGFNENIKLPTTRKYPNYLKMNLSPKKFIEKCTSALVADSNIQKQVTQFKRESMLAPKPSGKISNPNRASLKYSVFKTGNSTDVQLSSAGLDFLSHIQPESPSASSFLSQNEFEYNAPQEELSDLEFNVEDEIIRSNDKRVIGASFRALIYLLTDENNPPEYFFISTFFLTFRIFSDSAQLLEALIRRFDVNNLYMKSHNNALIITESKIRSRRKLIVKVFRFWLESYWNSKSDYVLLAPLMNFFNEGMKMFLPLESYQLLVTASKLIGHPPIENNNDRLNYYNNISNNQQLLPRNISSKLHHKVLSKMSLGGDANCLVNEIEAYNAFLDDIETYDLEKVDDSELLKNNSRISLSLSLNIELNNPNSNTILLTKQQISMIKMVILSYRRMLNTHWYKNYSDHQFQPLDTKTLIESWWSASQENWRILNDDLTLLNFNGLEIAKQLTLIESKLFCSIQVTELLNQNFTTKKLHLNLSPNIQKSILFTNLLSDYVIESILKPNLQIRQRIYAFKCWLKIAISCLYMRNFNSLASIMTSLQSFLITRVTEIWDGLPDKYKELFHYLASIIHPNKNYNTYRQRLRDFLATNLQENLDIPTVPYLSLFLQDLTFIVDGNPSYRSNTKSFLDEKLINIDKYFKITEIVSDIQTLQISYKDVGELGALYNNKNTDIIRSETIKNLKKQLEGKQDISFSDMFDITGVPILQELILLEIWKVKQTNSRDDDRSWKLSCAIHPREKENH